MAITAALAGLIGTGISAAQNFGSGLLSAGVSNWQNNKARAFAAEQQAEYLGWLEHMSNTAHQREVKDLRAAGLNPLLSVMGGQGASTPGGGMATPTGLETVGDKMNLALNASQIKLNNENANLQRQQQDAVRADVDLKNAQTGLTLAEKLLKHKDLDYYDREKAEYLKNLSSNTLVNLAQKDFIRTETEINNIEKKYRGRKLESEIGLNNSQTWRNYHQALGFTTSESSSDSFSDNNGLNFGGNLGKGFFSLGGNAGYNKGQSSSRSYSKTTTR